jgi:hypothetical protein
MLHALLHKNKLVGLYSDYLKCKITMDGLISNSFVDKKYIEIKSYFENSITLGEYKEDTEETNIDSTNVVEEFTDNNTTDTDNYYNSKSNSNVKQQKPTEEEIKKRSEIQNSINELKKKKEKMEESKRVFEVDLDLFNKFKKIKLNNINFVIPEMFTEKYELMEGLEKENKLCWENYYELYKPKTIATGYDKLFN